MFKPQVISKRDDGVFPGVVIYVGRPSKWGNPFEIGRDGTREEVIDLYRVWLQEHIELVDELITLDPDYLQCWCAPLACHADVLVEAIVWRPR